MKMKRVFAMLLALVMMLGLLPAAALAAEGGGAVSPTSSSADNVRAADWASSATGEEAAFTMPAKEVNLTAT